MKNFDVNAFAEHVKLLAAHVKLLAAHVKLLAAHVKLIPEHVKLIPEHVKLIPAQVKLIPEHVKPLTKYINVFVEHVKLLAGHAGGLQSWHFVVVDLPARSVLEEQPPFPASDQLGDQSWPVAAQRIADSVVQGLEGHGAIFLA